MSPFTCTFSAPSLLALYIYNAEFRGLEVIAQRALESGIVVFGLPAIFAAVVEVFEEGKHRFPLQAA